jgi:hypothetical protein
MGRAKPSDRSTFYGGNGRAYIDYPVYAELALAVG